MKAISRLQDHERNPNKDEEEKSKFVALERTAIGVSATRMNGAARRDSSGGAEGQLYSLNSDRNETKGGLQWKDNGGNSFQKLPATRDKKNS